MELIVEVEQRVRGRVPPNERQWNHAPVVPDFGPQSNVQSLQSAVPRAAPANRGRRAPLAPRPRQQTELSIGSIMPSLSLNAQPSMAQASPRRRFRVHRDPQVPSGPSAVLAPPRSEVLQDMTNLPLVAPPGGLGHFSASPPKSPRSATSSHGHGSSLIPRLRLPQDHVGFSMPMQNAAPTAGPPTTFFHDGLIDLDPILIQASAMSSASPPLQGPATIPIQSQNAILTPADIEFENLLAFHFRCSQYAAQAPALNSTPEIIHHLRFTAHANVAQLIIGYHAEEFRPYINTAAMQWFLSQVAN